MSTPRITVRLLIFDKSHRLLLMKIDDKSVCDPKDLSRRTPIWVTLGGRIEDGEDVMTAASRELAEETGITNAKIGPAVWYGEQELIFKEERTLLKETFVVVRTSETGIVTDRRTKEEHAVILETKWWTLDELRSTKETVLPKCISELAPALAAGIYPSKPKTITL